MVGSASGVHPPRGVHVTLAKTDPKFYVAVAAAMIDQARDGATPGVGENGRPEAGHTTFTREHLQLLHDSGATRADALAYAATVLNPPQVAKLATDLDSYGSWTGD